MRAFSFEKPPPGITGQDGLALVAVDEPVLGPALKWEPARGGPGCRARTRLSAGHDRGAPDDLDKLKRFCDLGAARVNVSLMSDARDEIRPILDKWADDIRQLRS